MPRARRGVQLLRGCDVRYPWAVGVHRLTFAGPRGHGHADRGEWLTASIAELKLGTDGDRERHSRPQIDLPSVDSLLLAPHPAQSPEDVPDLADGPVSLRARDLADADLEVGHAASGQAGSRRTSDPSGATASCCVGNSFSVKNPFSWACVIHSSSNLRRLRDSRVGQFLPRGG